MLGLMAKSTSINLRISPDFRRELEALANYRGLTLSGVAHSLLVRAVRQEKEREPEAFTVHSDVKPNNKVVGTITPGKKAQTKDEVRLMYQKESEIPLLGEEKPVRKKKVA